MGPPLRGTTRRLRRRRQVTSLPGGRAPRRAESRRAWTVRARAVAGPPAHAPNSGATPRRGSRPPRSVASELEPSRTGYERWRWRSSGKREEYTLLLTLVKVRTLRSLPAGGHNHTPESVDFRYSHTGQMLPRYRHTA